MDFMGFHVVDIILVSLALFLAIKGMVNGFSKEFFSFLTIIGGIALAARYNTTVVELINAQKIATIPDAYAKIAGFVIIIIAVWLLLGVISSIITKVTSNTTGIISRLFGYILSFARYAIIFSLIVFGVNQADFFKDEAAKLQKETKLFAPMTNIGAKLLNIELNASTDSSETTTPLTTEVTTTTTPTVETTEKTTETKTQEKTTQANTIEETKEEVKEEVKNAEENLSTDTATVLVDHNNSI